MVAKGLLRCSTWLLDGCLLFKSKEPTLNSLLIWYTMSNKQKQHLYIEFFDCKQLVTPTVRHIFGIINTLLMVLNAFWHMHWLINKNLVCVISELKIFACQLQLVAVSKRIVPPSMWCEDVLMFHRLIIMCFCRWRWSFFMLLDKVSMFFLKSSLMPSK